MGAASKRRKTLDVTRSNEGRRTGDAAQAETGTTHGQARPMQLNEGEAVVVVGVGSLVVLQGKVKLHGKVLQGKEDGSVRVPLACDAAFPVCVQSLGGGLESEGKGIPYAAARYADVKFEDVTVERVDGAFHSFFPAEWVGVAEDIGSLYGNDPCTSRTCNSSNGNNLLVAVVCGSKNTGKSSFSRYLVNTLLNAHESVLFLDMDCGQPEYTPPGLVSLFEVSKPMLEPTYMTRYARPLVSYFIGDTSPGSDPEFYEQSVTSLFGQGRGWSFKQRKKNDRAPTVMVVNTHGWIQGLGSAVLCRFLEKVAVDSRQVALVRMQADNPRHNLPGGLFFMSNEEERNSDQNIDVRDYHLPAISSSCASCVAAKDVRDGLGFSGMKQAANAAEKRTMQWHNFARHCISDRRLDDRSDLAMSITRERPYRIGFDAVTLSFFEGFKPADDDRAMQILNGSVVGLCVSPPSSSSQNINIPVCFGVGIVRSVCVSTRSLYILTPVPLEVLTAHVNHLVIGRVCDLPNSLLVGSPYLSMGCIAGSGGCVRNSRGNLARIKNAYQ